jgi:hypothetical protein
MRLTFGLRVHPTTGSLNKAELQGIQPQGWNRGDSGSTLQNVKNTGTESPGPVESEVPTGIPGVALHTSSHANTTLRYFQSIGGNRKYDILLSTKGQITGTVTG